MQIDEPAEQIIPITKAAKLTGVPIRSLRRMIQRGQCASVLCGHVRRVRLSAVRAAIRESEPAAQLATA
jgi:hypothetical protein